MEDMHILLFYKFTEIEDPEEFAENHKAFCKELGLKGRILVSKEGLNGSVSGTEEQTEQYKEGLHTDSRFSDMVFKEEMGKEHPFRKMQVKVKNEIIRLEQDIDVHDCGEHISPEDFLKLYESGEDIVVLDARNNYESVVGKFKGAITPDIGTFREFPKVAEQLQDKKDKKIIMYCTGGIRCEKASAYMKAQGFSNVYQLDGGIITFCQAFPDTVWEGKCFVFDKRMVSDVGNSGAPITPCVHCEEPCGLYRNCKNVSCNRLCIMCLDCKETMQGCCSEDCLAAYQHECAEKARRLQGKRHAAVA